MKKREYDSRPRTEFDPAPPEPQPLQPSQPAGAWQFCWKHRSWYGLTCGYCEGKLTWNPSSSSSRLQVAIGTHGEK